MSPRTRRDPKSHPANLLLAALPSKTYRRLQNGLERVQLTFGDVLYQPGDPTEHVYFPNDSMLSLLVAVEGNGALEVGMVGREGMVGIPLALGRPNSPVRVLVQGGGSAMRMTGARLASELKKNGGVKQQLDRCIYTSMMTAMQIAACNQSPGPLHKANRVAKAEAAMADCKKRVGLDDVATPSGMVLGASWAGAGTTPFDWIREGYYLKVLPGCYCEGRFVDNRGYPVVGAVRGSW